MNKRCEQKNIMNKNWYHQKLKIKFVRDKSCEHNLLPKVANKSYHKKSTQAAKRVVKKVINKIQKKN